MREVKKLEWDKIIYGTMSVVWSALSVFIVLLIIEYRGGRILKDLVGQSSYFIKAAGFIILLFWMIPVIVSMLLFVFLKIKALFVHLANSKLVRDPRYTNIAIFLLLPFAMLIPYTLPTYLLFVGLSLMALAYRSPKLTGSQFQLMLRACYLMVVLDLIFDQFLTDHTAYYGTSLFLAAAAMAGFVFISYKRRSFFILLGILGSVLMLNVEFLNILAPFICLAMLVNLETEIVYFRKLFICDHSEDAESSDLGKLKEICSKTSKVLFSILSKLHSRKRLDTVIVYAYSRGFEFKDGAFVPTEAISEDIIRLSQESRELVSYLLRVVKKSFGEKYTNLLLTSIFDNLFWSEKEIFDKYIIPEKNLMDIATLEKGSFSKLDFLCSVTLFSSFEKNELITLADNLKITKVKKGEHIITKGEEGDNLYIILEGEVQILSDKKHIATLFEKDFFGEVAIIKKCPRTADAIALRDSALLVLSKSVFGSFVDKNPNVFRKMDQSVRVLGFLKVMPFFRNLTDQILSSIATSVEVVDLKSKKVVLKEGESESDFFIIRTGKCSVTKDQKKLTTLVRGEFFGEMLILDEKAEKKATASIETLEDCTFYKIRRNNFRTIVDNSSMLRREFKVISSRRMLENRYNRQG
jgi:CRP-like cAMP-binding protein